MTGGTFGPLTLSRVHQLEGRNKVLEATQNKKQIMGTTFLSNSAGYYEDEKFSIRVTFQEAWDILGLVKSDELLYLDTSPNLSNVQVPIRGFYKVNKAEIAEVINNLICEMEFEATLISNNPDRPLNIDYSKIYGVRLQHTFDMTTTFNKYRDIGESIEYPDPFDTYDTTNTWESYETYGTPSTPNVYSSGGALVLECKASTDGKWAGVFLTSKRSQTPYFVVETMTDPMTTLSSGDNNYECWFYMSPYKQTGALGIDPLLRVGIVVKYNQWILYAQKKVGGTTTTLKSEAISNPSTDYPKWKITVGSNNTLSIDVDKGSGYYRFWGTANPGFNFNELYFAYALATTESRLLQQMRVPNIECYYSSGVDLPYVVSGPVGADYTQTPTSYRVGSEGNIPLWKNPTNPINLVTDPNNLYDGSVKAYRLDNGEYRQIWNCDEVLEPGNLSIGNSLISLAFGASKVDFQYYNPTTESFISLNEFTPTNYNYLEMIEWNSNRVIIQVDDCFVYMWRGKPYFALYHRNSGWGYTYRSKQYFDNGTGYDEYELGVGANINIAGAFVANVYESESDYRLSFIKQFPTTIKTNSLPADYITGIGVYNKNKTLGNIDHWLSLGSEFMTHTQQPLRIIRP